MASDQLTEIFGCHDRQADSYDARVVSGSQQPGNYLRENYFTILDRVIAVGEFRPAMKVLDIGIGTGLLALRMPPFVELHGVDISERMLEKLRGKGLPAMLQLGDFLHLPFVDHYFDRIVSTFALHHVPHPDKQRAFAEMDRVLRPAGSLVIADLMFEDDGQKRETLQKFKDEGRDDMLTAIDDEFFTDISSAALELRAMGFQTQYERGSTLSWILKAARSS